MSIDSLPNTGYDTLLYYLAQRQAGDWGSLARAAKEMAISGKLFGLANRLILLACLDLDLYGNRQWCLPPPTLVQIGEEEWFWTGFRTRSLLDQMTRSLAGRGELFFCKQYQAPTSIFLRCAKPEAVEQAAEENQVTVCGDDMPQRMLFNLPTVPSHSPHLLDMRKPFGKLDLLVLPNLTWRKTTPDAVQGMAEMQLIRYGNYYDRNLAIQSEGRYYRVGSGLAYYYLLFHRRIRVLRYQRRSRVLIAPFGAELPSLYGRSIVLHTGQLPQKQGQSFHYLNVTQTSAELAAQALGQILEVVNE